MVRTITFAVVLAAVSVTVLADSVIGQAAFREGDYPGARKRWKPLAEQGDAEAQSNLGVISSVGLGVVKDYRNAVNWFRNAAV